MKKITGFLLIGLTAFSTLSCLSMLTDNIDARANLAKCEYSVEKIEPVDVTLTNKSLVDTVSFDVYVKIKNTSPGDVAFDRMEGTIYLDGSRMATLSHKRFIRIRQGDHAVEPVRVSVPFKDIMTMKSGRPKNIGVKATLWVNLLMGSRVIESDFSITVEYETPIPYDAIKKMAEQKVKDLAEEHAGAAVDEGVDKILDLF